MKVKNLRDWYDKKEKMQRKAKDDVFVVSKERFNEINNTSFGVLVEEVPEEEPKQSTKKK